MSLNTRSSFFFGHTITSANSSIDIEEDFVGPGELQATLTVGDYTLEEFAVEVENQLNSVGSQDYSVTVDRTTRKITISAASVFSLLIGTGTRTGSSAWGLLGFTGIVDLGPGTSFEGDSGSGQEYRPQFIAQDHIDPENAQEDIDVAVNESSSGEIQVTRFGTRKFLTVNFRFITNLSQSAASPIENSLTGVADAQNFLAFTKTKARMEFMKDRDSPLVFESVLLESAPGQKKGTGFTLKEMFQQKLAGFFETGKLKFRVV